MTITKSQALAALIGVSLIFAAIVVLFQGPKDALGSIGIGNEYLATTTGTGTNFGSFSTGRRIKSGSGTLGQVTVTGAATGMVNFYDATTTNVNNRTNNTATSTILLASLPVSVAAGTYTFDVQFKDGLFLDLVSGNMPTTTVSYR